jgi:hypothetical protein
MVSVCHGASLCDHQVRYSSSATRPVASLCSAAHEMGLMCLLLCCAATMKFSIMKNWRAFARVALRTLDAAEYVRNAEVAHVTSLGTSEESMHRSVEQLLTYLRELEAAYGPDHGLSLQATIRRVEAIRDAPLALVMA